MQLVHVGAAVLNQTPLDWNGNRDRIVSAIEIARNKGISVICLPELCISGYGCEDAFQSPGVQRMAWTVLEEIVPFTHGVVVAIGLPVRFESGVYDAVAVVVNGKSRVSLQNSISLEMEFITSPDGFAHGLRVVV